MMGVEGERVMREGGYMEDGRVYVLRWGKRGLW